MKRSRPLVIAAIIIATIVAVGTVAFLLGTSYNNNSESTQSNNDQTTSDSSNTTPSTVTSANSYIATNQGLTSFPNAALSNPNIILLDISNNQITTLPSQIGQLTRLEDMNVSYNKLSGALPGEIRKMSLKNLNASHNTLTGVPAEIGQQPNLAYIDFSYNQLTGLPNEISKIPTIEVLDLSYNAIDSINDLSKFTNVKTLKLTGNKLTASQITQLKAALPNTEISTQ